MGFLVIKRKDIMMISNVSFKGNVYLTGHTNFNSKKSEVGVIKNYADSNECDVVVLNRDYYSNGTGVYETMVVKQDNITGNNLLYKKVFDFLHPDKYKSKLVPYSYEKGGLKNPNFRVSI